MAGEALDERRLSNHGPLVRQFESELAPPARRPHCIAVGNATVALEIAIRALELTGEVIVPSFTFIATAHALEWVGLPPVFCDIDPATHNLDPARGRGAHHAANQRHPRRPSLGPALRRRRPAGDRRGPRPEARLRRRPCLRLRRQGPLRSAASGDAEIFSFHATKFVNSFEGGAIATDDDALAARVRLLKNFGFAGYDKVVSLGTNGKMSEIAAAMGLVNLQVDRRVPGPQSPSVRPISPGLGGHPRAFPDRLRRGRPQQPSVHRPGGRGSLVRLEPGRDLRRPAGRERPGPPLFLARMPPRRAVSYRGSGGGPASSPDGGLGRPGPGAPRGSVLGGAGRGDDRGSPARGVDPAGGHPPPAFLLRPRSRLEPRGR